MASDDPEPRADEHAWPPGRQYLAVRRAIEEEWARSVFHEDWLPGRFVLASEWSEAKSHDVAGEVVRAWVRDASGLRMIAMHEYERLSASAPGLESGYTAVAFHVCADGRHVVYAIVNGPLSGHGGKSWIDPADPQLRGYSWLS